MRCVWEWLNPPPDGTQRSINNNSLVVRLVYRNFSALLTGDLEKEGESELVVRTPVLSSTLLKVAHHGSRSATLLPFLNRTQPRWAILSVVGSIPFGHPSREVLLRLIHQGILPLLTLDQGAITLETDGSRYVLSSYVSGVVDRGNLFGGSSIQDSAFRIQDSVDSTSENIRLTRLLPLAVLYSPCCYTTGSGSDGCSSLI